MRRPLFLLTLVTAVLAAACSASTAPGWTYAAPTPAPTPGESVGASGAPSASASGGASAAPSDGGSAAPSAAASVAPSGAASAGPSASASAAVVDISAVNIAFEQTAVTAPADVPFTIHFNNKEAVPHNVAIKDVGGAQQFNGDLVTGPAEVDYAVPALQAGAYTFVCIVHPNMTGTLTVGG